MGQALRSFHGTFGSDARMPSCEPLQRSKARAFASLFLIRQRGSRLEVGSTIRIFPRAAFGSNQLQSRQQRSCSADGRRFSSEASTWTSLMRSGGIACGFKVRNFGMLRSFLQALFLARNQGRATKGL